MSYSYQYQDRYQYQYQDRYQNRERYQILIQNEEQEIIAPPKAAIPNFVTINVEVERKDAKTEPNIFVRPFHPGGEFDVYAGKSVFLSFCQSFCQGLSALGIHAVLSTVTKGCDSENRKMFDINNPVHIQFVENLTKSFNVSIYIYDGFFDELSGKWHCTDNPYFSRCINRRKIFILKQGDHFKRLVSLDNEPLKIC